MDGVTITSISDKKNFDESTLNSPTKIIIKKENIGLQEHQHQNYQYSLFNNNAKRDHFYGDLSKVKDRLEKTIPNMQQVIHMDMKRVKTNKVYDRQLRRDLTGPRGLNWQYKQELQRLNSNEREAARDLLRLNRDLARVSISSLLDQQSSPRQSKDFSRSPTPRSSVISDTSSFTQTLQNAKHLRGRPYSVTSNRTTANRLTRMSQNRLSISKTNLSNEKSSSISQQINSKAMENHPYFQLYADAINQQKREIAQKLKQFLL